MTKIKVLTSAAALLVLAACESPTAQPTSANVNPADANFVTNAYQIILFDREESTQAETEARDPRVKAIAERLLQQANQFATNLAPVAKSLGITPPTVLRDDLRIRVGHMRLQHGLDFDRTYVDDQIASHEEALRNQEAMASQNPSPGIKHFVDLGQSLLRTNLDALRALRREMGGTSS